MVYQFKGKQYKIIEEKANNNGEDPLRAQQLLVDFKHCEEKKDWITIKNRITNGLMWGWLEEIS